MDRLFGRLESPAYTLLRVIAGFMFFWHGMPKIFGFLGNSAAVGSQMWIGGLIELGAEPFLLDNRKRTAFPPTLTRMNIRTV